MQRALAAVAQQVEAARGRHASETPSVLVQQLHYQVQYNNKAECRPRAPQLSTKSTTCRAMAAPAAAPVKL